MLWNNHKGVSFPEDTPKWFQIWWGNCFVHVASDIRWTKRLMLIFLVAFSGYAIASLCGLT